MHGVPTKKNSVIACHQPENKIVCRNIFPYLYGGEIIGTPCSNLTSVTQKQIWQKHLRKSCCLRLRRRRNYGAFATSLRGINILKREVLQHMSVMPRVPRKNGPFFEPPSSSSFRSFVLTAARPFVSLSQKKASGPTLPWV